MTHDTAQFTLTSEAASNSSAPAPFFDALSAAARAKLGVGADWEWYAAEVLRPTEDTLVTGGVPHPGRKGRGRWKGITGQRVVVTRAEMAAACAEFERETGKCYQCYGTGERNVGWSSTTGAHTKPCNRCSATGKPPVTP